MPLKPTPRERVARTAALTAAAAWGIGSIAGFLEGFVSLAVVNRYDITAYRALTHRLPIVETDASIIALLASPVVALFAILFALPNVEDGRFRRAAIALCVPVLVPAVVAVEFV